MFIASEVIHESVIGHSYSIARHVSSILSKSSERKRLSSDEKGGGTEERSGQFEGVVVDDSPPIIHPLLLFDFKVDESLDHRVVIEVVTNHYELVLVLSNRYETLYLQSVLCSVKGVRVIFTVVEGLYFIEYAAVLVTKCVIHEPILCQHDITFEVEQVKHTAVILKPVSRVDYCWLSLYLCFVSEVSEIAFSDCYPETVNIGVSSYLAVVAEGEHWDVVDCLTSGYVVVDLILEIVQSVTVDINWQISGYCRSVDILEVSDYRTA